MALDDGPEPVRPYVEKAGVGFPCLVDENHRVADLYGIINISTVVWIDEAGRIARANAIEYGTSTFQQFHGIDPEPHFDALRAWVRENRLPPESADVGAAQMPPTPEEQLARTEQTLARQLQRSGHREAAERHFARAAELAPLDWTIRRGSMPLRGQNPFGPEFFEIFQEWQDSGRPSYASEARRRR